MDLFQKFREVWGEKYFTEINWHAWIYYCRPPNRNEQPCPNTKKDTH